MEEKTKSSSKTKIIAATLTFIVIFFAVYYIIVVLPTNQQTQTGSSGSWHYITSFSGQGDKTTDSFKITSSKWRIKWSYTTNYPEYAMFSIFIYPKGETVSYIDFIDASGASKSDVSYVYQSGEFYLKIITANLESWQITIEAYY